MEFACGFVYVPPSLSQTDGDRPAKVIKVSALLPPAKRVRPRSPPPPPPTNPARDKMSKSLNSVTKVIQRLENKDVEKVTKPAPFYQNAEFHKKLLESSYVSVTPPQTPPPRRAALLPPHMRPRAASQPLSYSRPFAPPNTNGQLSAYDLPEDEPDLNPQPTDPNYSYNTPEGSGGDMNLQADHHAAASAVPALPPRPSFMRFLPEYLVVLPSSSSSSPHKSSPGQPLATSATEKVDKGPLPGNPNVVLVSLGKLLSEEKVDPVEGEPTRCSQCGSVLDTYYDNLVNVCYFCQPSDSTSSPSVLDDQLRGYADGLFLLNPGDRSMCATDAMLIFCIDISGSMSITLQVSEGEHNSYRSRLQFVQEAVIQCVNKLRQQQPAVRVGLITFNFQVTMHGYENVTSRVLRNAELIESNYLKRAGATFPTPPPLLQTKDYLERQVLELSADGTTALGPAALLAIALASRQSGSKVIICTDGKANTELGNLEVEDNDARTLLSSTIFYEELGEYAASQGVTVSVLSIEGTDCRLDELGRLADRTGGKVVIASPDRLHPEFEQIIENRTIATQCTVTLLLPQSLRMRGEREAGHKANREVGNVDPDTEITFQFGAAAQDTRVAAPASGSHVSVQLQLRYKKRNGQKMLRVLTTEREVTNDSSAALSSLTVAVIQLNSSQASAALAVRGRLLDARREGERQGKLMERALEHSHKAEDTETYQEWVKTMAPLYNNIHNFTRRNTVTSDTQLLTDAAAALLYTMKHSNRKSMKNKHSL